MTTSRRMAIQYVLLFGATGVSLPFAGLWFRAQGLSGAEIGVILAIPMLARLLTGPAIAVWADGFRARRTPIALLALLAAVGYGTAGLVEGLLPWTLAWFVGATAAAAMIPLTDVLTLRLAKREGFAFSVPRGVGSAAFVLANIAMGALLTVAPADAVIVWIVLACLIMALTAWRLAPAEAVAEGGPALGRERFRGIGRLVADPTFMMAILAVGAIQAAHGFYYGFSAIDWKAQGLAESVTGLLWAFSVAVEIAFMWWIEPWRRRAGIGAATMLMVGAGASVVRWTALALVPPLWTLWPLQALHALSFAATFLAGLELVERLAPPDSQTAAQTLSSALSSGVLIGLATLASGPLYDTFGAVGYLAMTALAAVGGLLALAMRLDLDQPT
ncbi:MFS transporter [Brevundimonas vitis]|uniref:MFS transporter n=1 Tax=Brevundimonas vitisensis TaxID=2800818 RepID=A0ABX7BPR9_9CAUL|nr:MFS transporter [Brevundimonas vitisensis]QQQ18858.1 MFS transporter [Brevundimonas vitisensis]